MNTTITPCCPSGHPDRPDLENQEHHGFGGTGFDGSGIHAQT